MTQQLSNFLRMKESAQHMHISRATLWRLGEQDPDFPKKVRITARCCGYLKSDLDNYLELKKGGKAVNA